MNVQDSRRAKQWVLREVQQHVSDWSASLLVSEAWHALLFLKEVSDEVPHGVHVYLPLSTCGAWHRSRAHNPLPKQHPKGMVPGMKTHCLCRQHYLHAKNLREAAALHSQLLRQLAGRALLPGIVLPRSPPALELPSQKVLLLLQRAIAAGWADQVCVRWGCICNPYSAHHWIAHSAKLQHFWPMAAL